MATAQPAFSTLMWSGVKGYVKGGVLGALVGSAGGALIGLAVGLLAFPAAVIPAVIGGIIIGGLSFGGIGSVAGSMTSIITKSREGQMSAEDAAQAVKVAFAKGVEIGQGRAEEPESSKWRDKYAQEKRSPDGSQRLH